MTENDNEKTKQKIDPENITCKQERDLMKEVGYKMQVAGETWYPISKKWWDSWKNYTCFDKGDDDVPGGIQDIDKRDIPRPSKIDNSELEHDTIKHALRPDIQENLTHVWIHEEKWNLVHEWYGGGSAFPRKVYEKGQGYRKEAYICKDPKLIKIITVDTKTGDINDKCKSTVRGFPRDYSFKEIAKEFEDEMDWDENDEKDDVPYVHLWVPFKTIKQIYPVDKKVTVTLEDLKDEEPNRWVEIPDDYLKLQIDQVEGNDEEENDKDDNNNREPENDTNNQENSENNDNDKPKKDEPKKKKEKNTVDVIAVEYIQFIVEDKKKTDKDDEKKTNKNENNDDDDDDNDDNSGGLLDNDDEKKPVWSRKTTEDNWKNFKIGQIVDVQDTQQSKWYECVIRKVVESDDKKEENKQLIVHYIGWALKWDEKIKACDANRVQNRSTYTTKPHRSQKNRRGYGGYSGYYGSSWGYGYSHDEGKPDQKGVVGLRNLGNTCFMNSTIQCLAQSPYLTKYFLKNEYIHHINKNNPLGWKGKVAIAWGKLLSDMFSNKYRTVAPRQFKDAIGEVAPRFTGYAQQDSQELLSFLLDGLHEDLNQIEKKPSTEAVESNGRKDAIVAAEAWKTYLKRNQSIVVDLMQGQYKSKVVCPDCDRISITFDPYMFLSVPLPTQKYKVIEYTYINCIDTSVIPTVYGIKINKFYEIKNLKQSIAKKHDVDPNALYVCDIWRSKFHRELRKTDSVAEINRRNDDIFVYHAPKPKTDKLELKEDPNAKDKDDDNNNGDNNNGDNNNGDNNNGDDDRREGGAGAGAGAGAGGAGDEYSYHKRYNQGGRKEYNTILIVNNRRVKVQRSEYGYDDEMTEDEPIGCPLLITVHNRQKMSSKQLFKTVFDMIFPFLRTRNEKGRKKRNSDADDDDDNNNDDKDGKNNKYDKNNKNDDVFKWDDNDLPFRIFATWGFNSNQEIFSNNDDLFDFDQSELKFIIYWTDYQKYRHELYSRKLRIRDTSAPPLPSKYGDDDDGGGRHGRPIELDACFEAFTEEEKLGENDAWYCSKCQGFKRAKKKIDLWTVPDVFIIHLKRFSYTRNYRDRINTLVKFPITGLNIKKFLANKYERQNCTYNLFAISNHMGGMGGGHYTAYAKNLYNKQWYHLDDSRTSIVGNTQSMISSSAYVLYYARVKPNQKRQKAKDVIIPSIERAASMEDLSNEIGSLQKDLKKNPKKEDKTNVKNDNNDKANNVDDDGDDVDDNDNLQNARKVDDKENEKYTKLKNKKD